MTILHQKYSTAEGSVLNRQTLSEQIYELLKKDIMQGRIGFGELLINREIQARFGASSTPVRDAINCLYVDGLVEEITSAGARVVIFDRPFIQELNEILAVLEFGAIRRTTQQGIFPQMAAELEAVVDRQSQAHTIDEYVLLDRKFHLTFFRCCGNRHLTESYSRYHALTEILVRLHGQEPRRRDRCIEQHRLILEACSKGDQNVLRELVDRHHRHAEEWFFQNEELLKLK